MRSHFRKEVGSMGKKTVSLMAVKRIFYHRKSAKGLKRAAAPRERYGFEEKKSGGGIFSGIFSGIFESSNIQNGMRAKAAEAGGRRFFLFRFGRPSSD